MGDDSLAEGDGLFEGRANHVVCDVPGGVFALFDWCFAVLCHLAIFFKIQIIFKRSGEFPAQMTLHRNRISKG